MRRPLAGVCLNAAMAFPMATTDNPVVWLHDHARQQRALLGVGWGTGRRLRSSGLSPVCRATRTIIRGPTAAAPSVR